ncbi:hypothetical protein [Caballeronia sordidicola]|uniref:hypothetical protein n=1 Tax=Caballeronia sordidicola TaxID=196367 RepID=UPI0004D02359|nr:hypothetical protein [Caballeronia sordidicola]
MNSIDAIAKVKERIEAVRNALELHKQNISKLESEEMRLSIALGVMQQIEADIREEESGYTGPPEAWPPTGSIGASKVQLGVPFVFQLRAPPLLETMMPPSTKHLIKALFETDKSLTRVEVIAAIKDRKPKLNEGTVATTLSKLVSEGFLMRDGNQYRRKDDIVGAGNTNDVEDLLDTDPSSGEGTPNPSYGEHGKEGGTS